MAPPGLFFDRPLVIGFSSSWHASSLRGFPTKLDSLSSSGLEFSTAYLLKWLAPFKSRFTNVLHALALVELSIAGSPRTLALCASTVSSSSCRANTCCRRSPLSSSSSLEGRREEDFSRFFFHGRLRHRASRMPGFHAHTFPFDLFLKMDAFHTRLVSTVRKHLMTRTRGMEHN
jgi:hypothetical protein